MEIKVFAPILIPTLNRKDHLKQCVESLAQCTHADKTELVIGLDYPPSEKYVEGWMKVKDYLPTIKGFKKVTILERNANYGPSLNNKALREYARQFYDRYIATEDDNVFSPNFLDYMNKCLEAYKDNPKVFAVMGYNYHQIDMAGYNHEYYFSHEMNAWGWGSWLNERCDTIQRTVRKPGYLVGLVKTLPVSKFLSNRTKLCNLIEDIGYEFRGDSYYTYYEWINDMYCVFPTLSMSRNMGFDGSGLHCGIVGQDDYSNQVIDTRTTFESDFNLPVSYDPIIREKFKYFQTGCFLKRCQKIAMLILIKIFVRIRRF